jgi:hypothetical protein
LRFKKPWHKQVIVAILFLLTLSAGLAAADERKVLQNEHLIIRYDEPLEKMAMRVQAIYPEVKYDLEEIIGWELKAKPTVVLSADRKAFEKMTGSSFVSAFAMPGKNLVVISSTSVISNLYLINDTLKHELCHLLLHENIKEAHLPKWLDEGVCQWVSGSFGEILIGRPWDSINLSRGAVSLKHLERTFPKDKDAITLAYSQSRSFVEHITSRYGAQSLVSILECLKEGCKIEKAVLRSTNVSLDQLEMEWREKIERSAWPVWLSQHLYQIMFVLAALLSVWGFIKVIARKRKRFAELDDEESDEP